jgi:RNA polymerase sigma-B factor
MTMTNLLATGMAVPRTDRVSEHTTPRTSYARSCPAALVNHTADHRDLAASATTEQLLRDRDELPSGHPARAIVRARVIEANMAMARRLARRYANRGELLEDLAQVAALALVRAVDGYDSTREKLFISYAIPSIVGSLKRHFRDTAWGMRVPRSTQELVLATRAASDELIQRLGRTATPVELAEHLHVTVRQVLAAQAATHAYRPQSLDAPQYRRDGGDMMDEPGSTDPRFAAIDDQLMLRTLVRALPARERRILTLRFYDEITQAQIGTEIGVSQMHVSRLLKQTLARLRAGMTASDPSGPVPPATPPPAQQ